MQPALGGIETALNEIGHGLAAEPEGRVDRCKLLGAGSVEDEVSNVLGQPQRSRMADSDAKPPEQGGSEGACNVPNAVVTAVPTALLEPNGTRGKVKLIVHHEDRLGRNLIEAGCGADRAS